MIYIIPLAHNDIGTECPRQKGLDRQFQDRESGVHLPVYAAYAAYFGPDIPVPGKQILIMNYTTYELDKYTLNIVSGFILK